VQTVRNVGCPSRQTDSHVQPTGRNRGAHIVPPCAAVIEETRARPRPNPSSAIVARPSGSETERGLRRALGARRHVATQFLLEAAALAVIGGILGVALGCLVTAVVAHVGGNPVTIPLSARLAGLGAATALGVLAGAYPAARAARLSPADALRAP